jgi:hypothetical protein
MLGFFSADLMAGIQALKTKRAAQFPSNAE